MEQDTIQIRALRDPGELAVVESLAARIFPETYREILTPEQIDYMMHMMYDDAVLRRELSEGMQFRIITDGETPAGFIAYHELEMDGMPVLKLEKLYLDFALHGRGIGSMALHYVISRADDAGYSAVILNVNKHNSRAAKAYRRAGFKVWRNEKNSIGNGYFMDDFVMRRVL